MDVRRHESVRSVVEALQPDLVVNAAAYTQVERAEDEPELAMAVNGTGAGSVAAACAEVGCPLIHLSTDYVFDGRQQRPYREDDTCAPLNVYGRSKLEGERAVRAGLDRHLILRVSWVFSATGSNFVRTMLGLSHLDEVRVVNDQVFRYDPGRLLRGPRLAGRLKFMLAPETARVIRKEARRLEGVAPERVRNEFMAILARDGARAQLEVLDRLDLLCRVIPELELTKGVEQPSAHYWDVWGHNLHTVEYAELITRGHQNSAIYSLAPWNAEMEAYFAEEVGDGFSRRTVLKLAGLLHDIAKPQTKGPDKTGRIRFLGHSELGAEMVTERLTHLRFSARIVGMVARMVEHHLRPAQLRHGDEDPTPRAVHRYYRDVGDVAVDTVYLAMADYLAAKGPEVVADRWANHARMLGNLLQAGRQKAPAVGPQRLLTGHDLMNHLGLPPGPRIGRLLAQIDEARAAGEIATREDALALADTLARN